MRWRWIPVSDCKFDWIPLRFTFTLTVGPLIAWLSSGVVIFTTGLTSSGCFIISTSFSGRGTIIKDCVGGGATTVVAVVLASSWLPEHEVNAHKNRMPTIMIKSMDWNFRTAT